MGHQERHRVAAIAPQAPASERQISSTHVDVAHAQPALVALVRDETRKFGSTVIALGLHLTQLAFQEVGGNTQPSGQASTAQVRNIFTQMTALLYHLDGADAAVVERALVAANSAQPELLQN